MSPLTPAAAVGSCVAVAVCLSPVMLPDALLWSAMLLPTVDHMYQTKDIHTTRAHLVME